MPNDLTRPLPPDPIPRPLENPLVVALAYDRLCTFEFACAVEVFGIDRPEMGPNWYQFAVAAVDPGPMRATGGIRIEADGGLDLLERAGTIIIPGWRAFGEEPSAELLDALVRAHDRGARLMSICSGVYILARTGLLDGHQATTHWRYVDRMAHMPRVELVPDVLYVDNGQVLTSAGSAAGLDLCLHLVRRDFGPEVANAVARRLVIPPHRDGGQAQFIPRPVPRPHEADRLSPLLARMRQRLDRDQPVAELAAQAGMSLRTFIRRFKETTGTAPGDWLAAERVAEARRLLEQTELGMEEIAARCGFGSPATLRHHFRRRLATSPSAYRETFSAGRHGPGD